MVIDKKNRKVMINKGKSHQEKIENAKKMLTSGLGVNTTFKYSGLPKEEFEALLLEELIRILNRGCCKP